MVERVDITMEEALLEPREELERVREELNELKLKYEYQRNAFKIVAAICRHERPVDSYSGRVREAHEIVRKIFELRTEAIGFKLKAGELAEKMNNLKELIIAEVPVAVSAAVAGNLIAFIDGRATVKGEHDGH